MMRDCWNERGPVAYKERSSTLSIKNYFLLFFIFFLSSSCSSLFYQGDSNVYFPPTRFGLSPQEVSFKSKEGAELSGWYFASTKAGPSLGTVIQFHGNGENMTSHYLSLAWLLREGYNLFTFDYQGSGKSKGSPSQRQVYFDALSALDQAWQFHQKSGAKKFIVYGQSLGSAVVARALPDWEHHDQVNLLVMDSSFYSYRTIARRILARQWVTWIVSPLGWLSFFNLNVLKSNPLGFPRQNFAIPQS